MEDINLDEITKIAREQEIEAAAKAKGFMPYNDVHTDCEFVENDIDIYIIPELQEACKELWKKNIFTLMCSNYDGNDGYSFVSVDGLSDENMQIFRKLFKSGEIQAINNVDTKNAEGLPVWWGRDLALMVIGDDIKENGQRILQLAKQMKMQDVSEIHYQEPEDYLISCGCYKEVPNPKYKKGFTYQDAITQAGLNLHKAKELFAQVQEPETIKVFDKTKMTKSLVEYVQENGDQDRFDEKTGNIYASKYYLEHHNNYVQATKETEAE